MKELVWEVLSLCLFLPQNSVTVFRFKGMGAGVITGT